MFLFCSSSPPVRRPVSRGSAFGRGSRETGTGASAEQDRGRGDRAAKRCPRRRSDPPPPRAAARSSGAFGRAGRRVSGARSAPGPALARLERAPSASAPSHYEAAWVPPGGIPEGQEPPVPGRGEEREGRQDTATENRADGLRHEVRPLAGCRGDPSCLSSGACRPVAPASRVPRSGHRPGGIPREGEGACRDMRARGRGGRDGQIGCSRPSPG